MKAYVIKNKEGKYFTNDYLWTNNICDAHLDSNEENVEKLVEDCTLLLKDCEVVRITISESDLDYENNNLKFQLENYRKENHKLLDQINWLINKTFELTKELENKEKGE